MYLKSDKGSGTSGEEALELLELLGRLSTIEIHRDGEADLAHHNLSTPAMLRQLRVRKVVRPKKKKPHWKTLAKKRKEYYKNTLKPRRQMKKASDLTTPEGWWKEASLVWNRESKKKRDTSFSPAITQEEFVDIIYPAFKGRVPIFKRLDTMKPVSVDNLLVIDVQTEEVLFDGSEYQLRSLGYIL